jgi:pyridoxine kinase
MKTVLCFHSHVAGARVGQSVAAFAMERLGVRVLQMPTVLFGRRPDRGKPGGAPVDATMLAAMLEGLRDDGRLSQVDAVVSGYVGASEQIEVIIEAADKVRSANRGAVFVCDPVVGDFETGAYVPASVAAGVLDTLVRQADWVCPNAWELSQIVGKPLPDLAALRDGARRLGKPTLVSSVPTEGGIGVLYTAANGDWLAETSRLPSSPKGAGDLLTALFVARRLLGQAPAVALEAAVGSVHDVIVQSLAAQSDDLILPEAQDMLTDPVTWPRARSLGT